MTRLCATRRSHPSSGSVAPPRSIARSAASCTAFSISEKRSAPKRRVRAATRRRRIAGKPLSMSLACSSARARADLLHHPNLHVAVLQVEHRAVARNGGRLVEGGRRDHEDPSDCFLGFDERSFDDLAAAHGETGTSLVLKLVRRKILPPFLKRAHPRHV